MREKILFLISIMMFAASCDAFVDGDYYEEDGAAYNDTSGTGEQANDSSSKINAIMENYADGPGGVVMVIQDGEIVFQNGYGFADLDADKPVTTNTAFHLGSLGKQFTAMGVMILSEQGKVDYDEPVSAYIPELDWMDDSVTVRRLLNHTSGIMGYDDNDELYDALLASSDKPGNSDLIQVLADGGDMLSAPGDEFYYSNMGYDILGAMIERISGQTYANFMEENVFGPVGMDHAFALPNPQRLGGSEVAISYEEGGAYTSDDLDNLNGSGSIYSTIGDMFLYDQALYDGTLVDRSTLDEAFTSGVLNSGKETGYGFGFDVNNYKGESYVGHAGSWLAFDSYYLRFTELKLSVVVLLNFDYSDGGSEKIAFEAADLYLK